MILIKENKPKEIYRNRKIIDTNHAIERFWDDKRFGNWTGEKFFEKEILRIVKNGIDYILDIEKDNPTSYVFYSKSSGLSVIVQWRKDTIDNDNKFHAIIITILPIMKDRLPHKKNKDILAIVENYIFELSRCEILKQENRFPIKEYACYDRIYIDKLGFDVYLWEGNFHDIDAIFYMVN